MIVEKRVENVKKNQYIVGFRLSGLNGYWDGPDNEKNVIKIVNLLGIKFNYL